MRKRTLGKPLGILLLAATCAARDADTRPAAVPADPADALLALPAPPRSWRAHLGFPPEFDRPPRDDAPLPALLQYWGEWYSIEPTQFVAPSPRIRQRLLDAAIEEPQLVPSVLPLLPETPEAVNRLKALHDRLPNPPEFDGAAKQVLAGWLTRRTRDFLPDLARAAAAVHVQGDSIDGADDLEALARLDWNAARPIVSRLWTGREKRLATLALSILYKHQVLAREPADDTRRELQRIATDPVAPAPDQESAVATLADTEWPGRDDWLLSLFSKDTANLDALAYVVRREPATWVPKLVTLLQGADAATHENAVNGLLFVGTADALRALLPELTAPARTSEANRDRLVQELASVNLPEAKAPLLLIAIRRDDPSRGHAIHTLAARGVPEAGPLLRTLIQEGRQTERGDGKTLLAGNAYDADEIADAIEAYAASNARSAEREKHPDLPAPPPETPAQTRLYDLGATFTACGSPIPDAAVEKLLARAAALASDRPLVAERIRENALEWDSPAVDRDLIHRLENHPDASTLAQAARRADALRRHVPDELRALSERDDAATRVTAAAALAIRADPALCNSRMKTADAPTVRMLLAVARLARSPLDLNEVGKLLDAPDLHLRHTAERYLIDEDSPAARTLVRAHRAGLYLIMGASGWQTLADADPATPNDDERRFRNEILADPTLQDVFVLFSAGGFGNEGVRVIYVRRDSADVTWHAPDDSVRTARLSAEQRRQWLDFVYANNADALPPLPNPNVLDGIWYTYVHFTRSGATRVFMSNPATADGTGTVYHFLSQRFRRLASPAR